jgi:excisionase family DNA binding protein
VTVDRAIEQLVDERVRLARASHQCACRHRAGAPPRTAFTIREVAESLGLSTRQVYGLAETGELPTKRIGQVTRQSLSPLRAPPPIRSPGTQASAAAPAR